MKKDYIKPEVEEIELFIMDEITTIPNPSIGEEPGEDDWM